MLQGTAPATFASSAQSLGGEANEKSDVDLLVELEQGEASWIRRGLW